jgi:hypothetical protein
LFDEGLLEETPHAATGGGIAATQPCVQNERSFGQYSKQRMVALAPRTSTESRNAVKV